MPNFASTATPGPAEHADPNVLEVTLPQFVKPQVPISPPILVSFCETRSDGNIPHMYQARLVISSINGVPQDPRFPPPTDTVLEGIAATPFALRTANKLWFLFGDLKFKPEWEGYRFKFGIQLWACWYDKTIKSWEGEVYQGEIETGEIACSLTEEWMADSDSQAWDLAQVESIRAVARAQPAATLGELTRKFSKITLHPDLLTGSWTSPDRPSRRTG
ncbi:hypothetical protein HRG_002240 [Hirsutella rhossiliensis]|uniref:Uncharacterized protein n=1 Tax=Hirsutella rhossiliensis TaxID=111463 RepID=A0A9P8SN55_9HYPO|nr:uncharacterized protein HRG_02240 [Hirsutella rhossiliensis]KAH0966831.1 hypothetical protein HRG_02240 [Hirsutella rhossiliensis]